MHCNDAAETFMQTLSFVSAQVTVSSCAPRTSTASIYLISQSESTIYLPCTLSRCNASLAMEMLEILRVWLEGIHLPGAADQFRQVTRVHADIGPDIDHGHPGTHHLPHQLALSAIRPPLVGSI